MENAIVFVQDVGRLNDLDIVEIFQHLSDIFSNQRVKLLKNSVTRKKSFVEQLEVMLC